MSQTKSPVRVVLSIAGSDSSAGAGIQADIKTGAAFGVHVATAITAVTAQNSEAVHGIFTLAPEQLRAQIDAVMESLRVDAIKIGMLGSEANIELVGEFLQGTSLPVVLDPVLVATSGASLIESEALTQRFIDTLFPYASVVTPNLDEAAKLLGVSVAENYEAMEEQARALHDLGCPAVLLKGGHLEAERIADVLVDGEGLWPYSSARINTLHSHGSGCTLASAIAAGLAQGLSLKQAIAAAKSYIQGSLEGGKNLGLVLANGPLHHFYQYW